MWETGGMAGYTFRALVQKNESPYGIGYGRITELDIFEGYDRNVVSFAGKKWKRIPSSAKALNVLVAIVRRFD